MILISAVVVESKETTTATTILSPGPGRLFGKKPYGPLGTESRIALAAESSESWPVASSTLIS